MSSSAAINRSITAIRNELDFLRESKVLSDAAYDSILSNLPTSNSNSNSNSNSSLNLNANLKSNPVADLGYVEALYDYEPQQNDDLRLKSGDKVKVLEKLSNDWWRGQLGGQIGVFPSNYVRQVGNTRSPPGPPVYQQQAPQQQQYYQQQQPPQQYYQQQQQQQPYYQQQIPMQQQVQVQSQQPHQQSTMGKIGSQLGQAAIFGAGATIGSDLVNAIF